MDYNQTFSKEYKRIFKVKELEIKGDLKKFSSQSITHHRAMGTNMIALKKLREEQSESEYDGLFELFTKSQLKYSKNQIKLSLENDVFPEFKKLNKTEDHAFEIALKELALITATDDIIYLLTENNSLICLMYQTDSLDLFELKNYGTPVEYTDLHKKLNAKLYPNQNTNHTKKVIKQYPMKEIENENNNDLNKLDKAFLYHSTCQMLRNEHSQADKDKLPSTELLRLNAICDFKDERFFNDKYRDTTEYKILTKGINHLKPDQKIYFLNNLISKIENLQLAQTDKFLKVILNKAYNRSIKK